METAFEVARRNRVVVASTAAAALAVAALAIVGIAVLLGWIDRPLPRTVPPLATAAKPPPTAATKPPAPAATSRAQDVVLLPGETLVEAPQAPAASPVEPLMPRYSAPTPPPAAPRGEAPRLIEKPLPDALPFADRGAPFEAEPAPVEAPAARPPARDRPSTPRYARREHPTSTQDRWPQPEVCEACGVITSVRHYRDLAEVRVRFDDGELRVIRYPPPSPWRAGDRVRLEDGRLLRD